MTEIVDEYVAADYAEAKRLVADAKEVALRLQKDYSDGKSVMEVSYTDIGRLLAAYTAVRGLSYKLDEAVGGLRRYAEPSFWLKVPTETYAEDDKGSIAVTTLNRIFPV